MSKNSTSNCIVMVLCLGLLIWAAVVLRHYFESYPGYFIALNFIDTSLVNVVLLLVIAGIAWLWGRAVLKVFRFKATNGLEEFLLANALGFITITYVFILGGFLNLYYPAFAYISLGLILLAAGLILRNSIITPRKASPGKEPGDRLKTWEIIFLVFLSIEIIINFLHSLVPPTSHDALMMHLLWPKQYVEKAGIIPRLTPLNIYVLYTGCLLISGDILAKLLNFYFSLLALGSVYWLGHKLSGNPYGLHSKIIGRRGVALLAALIFYSQPVTAYIARRAYTDIYLVFYETLALGLLIDYLRLWSASRKDCPLYSRPPEPSQRRQKGTMRLLLIALFLGYALGAKYLALFALPAFALVLLIHLVITEEKKWLGLAKALGVGILILIFSVWSIRNLVITGNPIYPVFSNVIPTKFPKTKNLENFKLRYGQLEPEELQKLRQQLGEQWRQGAHLHQGLVDWFTLPWKITMSTEYPLRLWGNRILPVFLILLPFIIFLRRRDDWLIMAFIIIFLALWSYGVQHIRYAVPALAWLSYICALSLSLIPSRLFRAVFLVLTLIIIGCYVVFELVVLTNQETRPYAYALGLESGEDYLERSQIRNIYTPISQLNEVDKREPVKLICFADSRVYYCQFPVTADNPNYDYTLLFPRICGNDPQKAIQLLKENGYTHLLFNRASLHDLFIRGQVYGRVKGLQQMAIETEEFLNQTIELGLEKIYEAMGVEVYRIGNGE